MDSIETPIIEIIIIFIWIVVSLVLLAIWLKKTRFGRDAFSAARSLPVITGRDVLIAGGFFLGVQLVGGLFIVKDELNWRMMTLRFTVLVLGQLAMVALIMTIFFSRNQKVELSFKHFDQTVERAVVYYIAAGGLVMLILLMTLWISGVELNEARKHEILDLLGKFPPWHTVVVMVVGAVLAAPLCEELLFRGLLQPFLIDQLDRVGRVQDINAAGEAVAIRTASRWGGIFLTSVIFAVLHGEMQHWPAIWALGVILGVAYDRFGNLLIPILVHFLFNGVEISLLLAGN